MVAGKLDDFRARLFAVQFNSFVATCHTRLSIGQRGRLKDDWDRAAAFISQNLKVRLQFYESLPWVILGGARPEPQTARSSLERALGLWEKLPEEAKHLQHKLATDLFMPGPLLDDLQRFLSGEELEDCPCLEPYLAPLCFVPIAERIIEGAHKDLGEVSNKTSVTALSIEMRASELNRTLSLQPDLLQKLLECFVVTRAVTKISSIFPCFQNHPLLVGLRASTPSAVNRAPNAASSAKPSRIKHCKASASLLCLGGVIPRSQLASACSSTIRCTTCDTSESGTPSTPGTAT